MKNRSKRKQSGKSGRNLPDDVKQFDNSNQLKGFENFTPNGKQKVVNNLLTEHPLVFVQGYSGTGKTSGVLHHYCREYMNDKSKSIIVIRTPVEAGPDKIGALPGGQDDKLEPHFSAPALQLKKFLGNKFESDKGKRIKFMVPNYALGMTLDDGLILIDEAQQIHPLILKMLLERIGENSVCAVVGDPTQLYATDVKNRNGLAHAMDKFFVARDYGGSTEYEPKSPMIASFQYEASDNVRSDISREVVRIYS